MIKRSILIKVTYADKASCRSNTELTRLIWSRLPKNAKKPQFVGSHQQHFVNNVDEYYFEYEVETRRGPVYSRRWPRPEPTAWRHRARDRWTSIGLVLGKRRRP